MLYLKNLEGGEGLEGGVLNVRHLVVAQVQGSEYSVNSY